MLVSHGLQGLGGTGTLNLMLVRQVTEREEGVTDSEYHTLRYGYLPHPATSPRPTPEIPAYEFNQPLIPVWRTGNTLNVQLPFEDRARQFKFDSNARTLPNALTILSAEGGIVSDLYRYDAQVEALTINYDPTFAATLHIGEKQITLPGSAITLTPIELK